MERYLGDAERDRLDPLLDAAEVCTPAQIDDFMERYLGDAERDRLDPLLDAAEVCTPAQIDDFVERYLGDAERDRLDPLLDACVAVYSRDLDEDGQVAFKGKAKAFVRTYAFLSSVLPYTNPAWEKRSIFLNFLIPKLPAPCEEGLSRGILDAIDMDSSQVGT